MFRRPLTVDTDLLVDDCEDCGTGDDCDDCGGNNDNDDSADGDTDDDDSDDDDDDNDGCFSKILEKIVFSVVSVLSVHVLIVVSF